METEKDKTSVSWSAPEYEYSPKSKEWYWTVGIISAALAFAALLLKNFLFASFILLAGFTAALFSAKKPRVIKFVIGAKGIQIADRLYPYDSLKSFWIRYDPPEKKELEILTKKIFVAKMSLPLGDADPNEVRRILMSSLKEEETKESLIDIFAKYIGF